MSVGASAAAGAAAVKAAQAYELLVGGLLLELAPEALREVHHKVGGLVLMGSTQTFWTKRPKTRFYFLPHQGVTLYCRIDPEQSLDIPGAIEVPTIKLGPLADHIGK
jgi:hypothetical protein